LNEIKGEPEVLREAIWIEIYGREYYSIFSDATSDDNARAILRGLARDEAEHQSLLEKEYKRIKGKEISKEELAMLSDEGRKEAEKIFPRRNEILNISDSEETLRVGITTELNSIQFYSGKASQTRDKKLHDLFIRLKMFEEGHRKTLEDALYYLEREGTWYGYTPPTLEG